MKVLQTTTFYKLVKKLHKNQKLVLDSAIKKLVVNPLIGDKKTGELKDVYVYKFQNQKQQILLAYMYNKRKLTLTLLTYGSHENFYKNLKRSKK